MERNHLTKEQCTSCEQMKKENKQLRANRDEAVKNLVEVVNENLALRRESEELKKALKKSTEKIEDLEEWNCVG